MPTAGARLLTVRLRRWLLADLLRWRTVNGGWAARALGVRPRRRLLAKVLRWRTLKKQQPPAMPRAAVLVEDQKDASSSSMVSLSMDSTTVRTLVSSGSMFLAKNDADAILPS